MVKNIDSLEGGYLTHGPWPDRVKSFLKETNGDYLEVGSYYGQFIAEVSLEFPSKKCFSIDPFISDGWTGQTKGTLLSSIEETFQSNVKDLNIKHFKQTSKEFFEDNSFDEIQNVSCMLIDGSHHYPDVIIDIEIFNTIKNNFKKYVVFDDLHIKGVKDAVQFFREEFKDRILSEDNTGEFFVL